MAGAVLDILSYHGRKTGLYPSWGPVGRTGPVEVRLARRKADTRQASTSRKHGSGVPCQTTMVCRRHEMVEMMR